MPLPWKKSKSSRISRFVSDFQQSPKHGGSLVVETGFPTSLIDLFVKNRNRLKKQSSKRNNNNDETPNQISSSSSSHPPPRRRVSSPPPPSSPHPPPPPLSSSSLLPRHRSLPVNLDQEEPITSKIEEVVVDEGRNEGGDHGGGGGCVLMVVALKVFVVAVLALSTKKLAVGITLSAFTLLFLEFAVARVLTLLNICPNAAEVRIDSLIVKLIGKKKKKKMNHSHQEIVEEDSSSTSSSQERKNRVTFEIIEEPIEESRDDSVLTKPVVVEEDKEKEKEKEVVTIRDVVFKNEKSKSAKLKSKIVKKIVPKKLRSYKKKRKMMKMKKGEEEEEVEIIGGGEEDGSITEVSSLYSEDRVESEISERDDETSNPPFLESCEEEIIEQGGEGRGTEGDLTKVIGLIVIVLAGLLSGKVLAIGLTLCWCLILRVFCCKSRTSL